MSPEAPSILRRSSRPARPEESRSSRTARQGRSGTSTNGAPPPRQAPSTTRLTAARVLATLAAALAGLATPPAPAEEPAEAIAAPSLAGDAVPSVDRALMDRRLMEVYGPGVPFDAAQRLAVDLTCDGATDQVAGWYDPHGPGGPTYAVAVATADTPDGVVALIPFDLPMDPGRQMALCPVDDPADIRLEVEKWSPAEQRDVLGLKPACPRAIAIVDGRCDSPRLFWNGFAGDGPPLIFFRN